jgi:hypothetical protein
MRCKSSPASLKFIDPGLTKSRVQGVRYGQGRLHLKWRAVSSVEADGRKQPEGPLLDPFWRTKADKQDQQLQQIVDKTIMEADKDG